MRRALAAAALLAVGLVACSGGGGTGAAPAPTVPTTGVAAAPGVTTTAPAAGTACALVTRDEMQVALGARLDGEGIPGGTPGATSICTYRSGQHILLVRLNPQTGADDHALFPYGPPQDVEGLGDDAKFAHGEGEGLSALSVVRGPLGITVIYRGPGDHLSVCTAVARTALAKL